MTMQLASFQKQQSMQTLIRLKGHKFTLAPLPAQTDNQRQRIANLENRKETATFHKG